MKSHGKEAFAQDAAQSDVLGIRSELHGERRRDQLHNPAEALTPHWTLSLEIEGGDLRGPSLAEAWRRGGGDRSHAVEILLDGTKDQRARAPSSQGRAVTVMGRMPFESGQDDVYFGWYTVSGRAKFFSARGNERAADVYGRARLML